MKIGDVLVYDGKPFLSKLAEIDKSGLAVCEGCYFKLSPPRTCGCPFINPPCWTPDDVEFIFVILNLEGEEV